jgi:hypothetical protein
MQTVGTKIVLCVLLTGALSVAGCASRTAVSSAEPNAATPEGNTAVAEIVRTARIVLTRMHFAIEKSDPEEGVVRTRPLRGAQFFELWRSDNASAYDWAESNLQSIRRTAEVRVRREGGGQKTEDGNQNAQDSAVLHLSSGLCVTCAVSMQRLSLAQREVADTAEAYQVHASSTAALQRLQLSSRQRLGMTWIDLGCDPDLAARILSRVEQKLQD